MDAAKETVQKTFGEDLWDHFTEHLLTPPTKEQARKEAEIFMQWYKDQNKVGTSPRDVFDKDR